ncbi:hypothetical protein A2U01_0119499, partial [Trifolium medium]|nr:hypothetical protein [Trifolium medium]
VQGFRVITYSSFRGWKDSEVLASEVMYLQRMEGFRD